MEGRLERDSSVRGRRNMSGCLSGEERVATSALQAAGCLPEVQYPVRGCLRLLVNLSERKVIPLWLESMSLAPSPSSSRGEIILQPAYFTSSAFVHAARADVSRLIQDYSQQYTRSAHSRNHPFTLFKEIWQTQGWTWIQFKVFDTRSRAAFLRVVMRLFSGQCLYQNPISPT